MSNTAAVEKSTRPPNGSAALSVPGELDQVSLVQEIPLEQIVGDPNQPRKTFDPEKLNELADSIRAQGVLQPIVVRPTKGVDAKYMTVVGERRFRASKLAGKAAVPAIIRELSDREVREIQAIENDQREDVTALEQARGYQSLLEALTAEEPKASQQSLVEKIAARIGKSARYVWMRLKLARDLAPEVRKALEKGEITASHADELVRLQPTDQKQLLEQGYEWQSPADRKSGKARDFGYSVRDLKEEIAERFQYKLAGVPWKLDDRLLIATAGSCTDCAKNTLNDKLNFPNAKDAECTDGSCFRKKQVASIRAKAAAAKEKFSQTPLWLRSTYNPAPKEFPGALDQSAWEHSKAEPGSCKFVEVGIIVDGSRAGSVVTLCRKQSCTAHWGLNPTAKHGQRGAAPKSPTEAQLAAKRKEEANVAGDLAVLTACLKTVKELDAGCIGLVVGSLTNGFDGYMTEEIERALLSFVSLKAGSGYDRVRNAWKNGGSKLKSAQKAQLMVGLALAGSLDYGFDRVVVPFAKSRKVDAKTVRAKAVRDELARLEAEAAAKKSTTASATKAAKKGGRK